MANVDPADTNRAASPLPLISFATRSPANGNGR